MDSVFLSPFAVPFAAPMPTPSGIGAALPFLPTTMPDASTPTPLPAAIALTANTLAPAMFVSSAMAEMPPAVPIMTAPGSEPVVSDMAVNVALPGVIDAPTPPIGPDAAIDTSQPNVPSEPNTTQVPAPAKVASRSVSPEAEDRPNDTSSDRGDVDGSIEKLPVDQSTHSKPDSMPTPKFRRERVTAPAPQIEAPRTVAATPQADTSPTPGRLADPVSFDERPAFDTDGDDDAAAMRAAPEEATSPAAAPAPPVAPTVPQAAPPPSPAPGMTIVPAAPEIAIDAAPAAAPAKQQAPAAPPRSEPRKASTTASPLPDTAPADAIIMPTPQPIAPPPPKRLATEPDAKDGTSGPDTSPAPVTSASAPRTPDAPHVADRPAETVASALSPGTAVPNTFTPTPTAPDTAPPRQTAQPEPVVVAAHSGRIGHETGVAIARHAVAGVDTVAIRLDPGDMGRIEVRLSFEEGGTLRAVVAADNPASLDLLRRDTAQLVRALGDAGIATDAGSFRFDTRSDDRGGNGGGWQRPQQNSPYARDDGTEPQPDASEPYRRMTTRGRVEIMA